TLTEAEIESLKAAFELSMLPAEERVLGDEEALLYGGYEPLSMAVCHIINNKAGLSFTSYAHTGLQIPVYAMGVGAENFAGLYDNTDIFTKTMAAMGLQADAQDVKNASRAAPAGSPLSLRGAGEVRLAAQKWPEAARIPFVIGVPAIFRALHLYIMLGTA